jgi:hypothetical protein
MQTQYSDEQKRKLADNYVQRMNGRNIGDWSLPPEGLTPNDIGEAAERMVAQKVKKEKSEINFVFMVFLVACIGCMAIGLIAGVTIGRTL